MSSTLTWRVTTAAKTGTGVANLIDDIVSAVNAVSGNADYKWEVASSNNSATPYYVVLKRKDASAGRILLVVWTSGPAGVNSAILDASPASNTLFLAYFPSGNVDSPSNLTAASGTIMGDDSNCTKVVPIAALATMYTTSYQPYVWDSEEAVYFIFQNPAAVTAYWCCAGAVFVDAADDAYEGAGAGGGGSGGALNLWGASNITPAWNVTPPSAGGSATTTSNAAFRGIDGSIYYFAFGTVGSWQQAAIASSVLYDTGINRAWFVPNWLIKAGVGQGFPVKLRQVATGPATTAAHAEYNTLTLTPAAINGNAFTSGANSSPWFCNFKI